MCFFFSSNLRYETLWTIITSPSYLWVRGKYQHCWACSQFINWTHSVNWKLSYARIPNLYFYLLFVCSNPKVGNLFCKFCIISTLPQLTQPKFNLASVYAVLLEITILDNRRKQRRWKIRANYERLQLITIGYLLDKWHLCNRREHAFLWVVNFQADISRHKECNFRWKITYSWQ